MTDIQERDKALDRNKSFIVQAPAGSGKTTLLIQRYLVLLAHAEKMPEEILAITFTRKAAAEMRSRIITALENAAHSPAPSDPHKLKVWQLATLALERDQQLNWQILANPNRLRILTIDGLCASLTREMPVLSRFGAEPKILEDHETETIYKTAAQNLLLSLEANTTYHHNLRTFLLHLDNDWQKAEALLVAMLKKRDQWLPHVVNYPEINILEGLNNIANDNILSCKNCLTPELIKELHELATFAITGFASLHELNKWQKIAGLLLTKDYSWRKNVDKRTGFPTKNKVMKERMSTLLEKFNSPFYAPFKQSLQYILLSPLPEYSLKQQDLINSLVTILKVSVAHLKILFKEQGAVDYIEIALAALEALGIEQNPTDLALKLDYQINHILVDEFQDTATTQYHLLEKLTANWQPEDYKTLFLVGDPMQSIYKFREAKVGLFLRAKHQGINNIKLHTLTLTTNFRSEQYLIAWVNHTFAAAFPRTENIATGAIPFIPAIGIHNNLPEQKVHLYRFLAEEYTSEAQQVIKIIKETQHNYPADSIAILVRNRSHLQNIIPELKAEKLTYQAVELEALNEHPVIQDLFALTRALINPLDRIAWLAILRAPWCGLTLHDLHALAHNNHEAPLWETLINWQQIDTLSADGKSRLTNLVTVLTTSLAYLTRLNLRDLVEKTWLDLGGEKCLSNNNEFKIVQKYLQLLDSYQTDVDLEIIATKLTTLFAESEPNPDYKLQIMTIHKAKGLEFDSVIIPGLNREPRHDNEPLLLWSERPNANKSHLNSDLILAPIKASGAKPDPVYCYLKFEESQKNYYEIGRLLYVAVTRAKRRLHLLATVKDDKPNHKSLLEQIWPCFRDRKPLTSAPIFAAKATSKYLLRLPTCIENKLEQFELMPKKEYIANLDKTAQNIGIVIHKSLEQLSKIDLSNWLDKNLATAREKWQHNLIQLGTYDNRKQHLLTIELAIRNTLQDPTGQWILNKDHQDAHSEYELAAVINNEIRHFTIDRTFIADNKRWIIDYKTSKNDPNNYEQYRAQLFNYAKAMRALDPNTPIALGIYFPLTANMIKLDSGLDH